MRHVTKGPISSRTGSFRRFRDGLGIENNLDVRRRNIDKADQTADSCGNARRSARSQYKGQLRPVTTDKKACDSETRWNAEF